MAIPYILLQTVAVPLLATVVVYVLGGKLGKNVGWIAFAALLYTSLLLLSVGVDLFYRGVQVQEKYSWAPSAGLTFGFSADNLSLPVALMMNVVCAATAVYSMPYMKHRLQVMYSEEKKNQYSLYFVNYLLFAVGLVGVALSTNLIELYLFVELVLIPSYLLIGLFGYIDKERIALMYFIWNHVGAFVFLAGILLVYFGSSSFEIAAMPVLRNNPIAYWVVFLILVGWLIKMATFGFHVWLPFAHGEHPTSIAAIIAIIVGLGNYIIVRLLVGQLFNVFQFFALPLMVLAVITMFYAGYSTMVQDDVKRLYAWSTIGQTAYSLLGIGSLTLLGVTGGIFYFVSHTLGKCILFSTAGILLSQTGTRDIKEMGGLARKMPVTAIICLGGTLILSAVPPSSGFQAEWIMFTGIFTKGTTASISYGVVAVLGLIETIFTVAYTFWPVRRIFFGRLPGALENVKEAPLTMTLPLLSLVAISFLIGIYPEFIMRFVYSYVHSLPSFVGG
jgi:NADH-quinone oxidoreductase subunit M